MTNTTATYCDVRTFVLLYDVCVWSFARALRVARVWLARAALAREPRVALLGHERARGEEDVLLLELDGFGRARVNVQLDAPRLGVRLLSNSKGPDARGTREREREREREKTRTLTL